MCPFVAEGDGRKLFSRILVGRQEQMTIGQRIGIIVLREGRRKSPRFFLPYDCLEKPKEGVKEGSP